MEHLLTLVNKKAKVWGVAYELSSGSLQETKSRLDDREKRYNSTVQLPFFPSTGDRAKEWPSDRLVTAYLAPLSGPLYLGPDSDTAMAEQIMTAAGPSGDNLDYLIRLWQFMADEVGEPDDHVTHLVQLCQNLKN